MNGATMTTENPMQKLSYDSTKRSADLSLGDGMKTLLLSLIAYVAAFAYECGYCDWFAIPHDLIRLDITRFLVFAAALAAFLTLTLGLTPMKSVKWGGLIILV